MPEREGRGICLVCVEGLLEAQVPVLNAVPVGSGRAGGVAQAERRTRGARVAGGHATIGERYGAAAARVEDRTLGTQAHGRDAQGDHRTRERRRTGAALRHEDRSCHRPPNLLAHRVRGELHGSRARSAEVVGHPRATRVEGRQGEACRAQVPLAHGVAAAGRDRRARILELEGKGPCPAI